MKRELLRQMLRADEGTGPLVGGRLMLYRDCCGKAIDLCACEPKGPITGGYGHNFSAKGLTYKQADYLLEEDIDDAVKDCLAYYPWYEALNAIRQLVLTVMMFNLGAPKLAGFRKFLRAAREGDHDTAAVEMLDSKWADDIGKRASHLAELWRRGEWI